MASSIELRAAALRVLPFGSIVAGYTAIGTPFNHPMRQVIITNLTNAVLLFSYDGIIDHIVLSSNGFMLLDITTNDINNAGWFVSKGTQIYVKRDGTPTSGSAYVMANFARGT